MFRRLIAWFRSNVAEIDRIELEVRRGRDELRGRNRRGCRRTGADVQPEGDVNGEDKWPVLDCMTVVLGLDISNEEIVEHMRKTKAAREAGLAANVNCIVGGFDDDPRELWDVPEVRAFFRRLRTLGFGSYLDPTTALNAAGSPMTRGGFGCLEVHLIAEGEMAPLMRGEEAAFRAAFDALDGVVAEANGIADELLGPFVKRGA